eukprot:2116434-Pyramimonas_sp.AAC.1
MPRRARGRRSAHARVAGRRQAGYREAFGLVGTTPHGGPDARAGTATGTPRRVTRWIRAGSPLRDRARVSTSPTVGSAGQPNGPPRSTTRHIYARA